MLVASGALWTLCGMNILNRAVSSAFAILLVMTSVAGAQGTLQVDGKDYKLENVVAYETKSGDDKENVVLITAKPIPMDEFKAKLKAGSVDNFFVFDPQVQLTFDQAGKLQSLFVWADNNSISGGGSLDDAKVEASFAGGKAKGKVAVTKEESDPKYKFDVSFDASIMK
jgi:hypothetical protein